MSFTERLRLEPVGAGNARDLWLVLSDDAVWPWYGGAKPTYEQMAQSARDRGEPYAVSVMLRAEAPGGPRPGRRRG